MPSQDRPTPHASPVSRFATTHWSLVRAAGGSNVADAREAMAALCRGYWYPLYAYARRRGHAAQDAEDLTQEFFVQLLEHNWVARADDSKGRFRTFLLTAFVRFLANAWDKAACQKRGGHLRRVCLSMEDAEGRFAHEPADACTPEQLFERQWALTVLEQVLARLREDYARAGQAALFDALKPRLVLCESQEPYDRLAAKLGMSVGSVKTAVFRLRRRYRERLLEAIAQTVASEEEVESELQYLFEVLSRR